MANLTPINQVKNRWYPPLCKDDNCTKVHRLGKFHEEQLYIRVTGVIDFGGKAVSVDKLYFVAQATKVAVEDEIGFLRTPGPGSWGQGSVSQPKFNRTWDPRNAVQCQKERLQQLEEQKKDINVNVMDYSLDLEQLQKQAKNSDDPLRIVYEKYLESISFRLQRK